MGCRVVVLVVVRGGMPLVCCLLFVCLYAYAWVNQVANSRRYLWSHIEDPMRLVLLLLSWFPGFLKGCYITLGYIALLHGSFLSLHLRMHCRSWCTFSSRVFFALLEQVPLGFILLFTKSAYGVIVLVLVVGFCRYHSASEFYDGTTSLSASFIHVFWPFSWCDGCSSQ